MPSGRCRSCGGDLPADARFCPRCGTGLDEVPLLPLLGAQEAPTPTGADGEGPGASSGMRTVLVLVAGVVVLLLGLSAFAGGDDEPEDDAADQSDRADDERGRATRSTSTSRPSTTTMPGLLPDGGVPEAAGAVAIHASDDQLLVADLGTGRQIAVPGPGGPVQAILAHGAHLLVTAGGDTYVPDADRLGMWSERDIELDSRYGRDPNSTLLVVDDHTVGAMDEDGALSTWDLPPSSQAWSVRGLVGAEVIINSYEGAFLVDRDGNARRIHQGTALATNGHEILLATCDDALLCRPVVVDPSGAVVETLPPFPEGYALGSAALGPDGTDILVEGDRWERGELDRGVFRHTAQGWVASGTGSGLGVGTAVWIPGTGTAVWWQPDVMSVNALPAEGEPVRFRLSTVDGSSTWGLVAVTTIDLLPEEWRAELAG